MSTEIQSLVVGIAGGSASGKSTFTAALLEALPASCPGRSACVMHSDRYFRLGTPDMPKFFSPSSGTELPDFNRPDAIDTRRLLTDLDATVSDADAPDVVILEGHLVLAWPEVRERLDLSLFVDLDGETRALRRIVRNLEHKGDPIIDHSPQSIANYYLESAKVGYERYIGPSRAYADLILRGDADFTRTAPFIAAVIAQELAR